MKKDKLVLPPKPKYTGDYGSYMKELKAWRANRRREIAENKNGHRERIEAEKKKAKWRLAKRMKRTSQDKQDDESHPQSKLDDY